VNPPIDVGAKSEIYNLLASLSMKGISIIVISSEVPEVYTLSDRLIVIRRGQVVLDIDKNDIGEDELMRTVVG